MGESILKTKGNSLEHVHEYIKLRMKVFGDENAKKFEDIAINALTQDE